MPGRSPLSLQVLAPLITPKGYNGLCHRFFLRNGREGFTYTPSCSRCSISKTKRDCKRRSSNCEAKRNGSVAGHDSSLLCFWFRLYHRFVKRLCSALSHWTLGTGFYTRWKYAIRKTIICPRTHLLFTYLLTPVVVWHDKISLFNPCAAATLPTIWIGVGYDNTWTTEINERFFFPFFRISNQATATYRIGNWSGQPVFHSFTVRKNFKCVKL